MNLQSVNELTHLYTALNPELQLKKSAQPEVNAPHPVLVKIENWLESTLSRIREGAENPVKDSSLLASK
jgi:hypothetical protein